MASTLASDCFCIKACLDSAWEVEHGLPTFYNSPSSYVSPGKHLFCLPTQSSIPAAWSLFLIPLPLQLRNSLHVSEPQNELVSSVTIPKYVLTICALLIKFMYFKLCYLKRAACLVPNITVQRIWFCLVMCLIVSENTQLCFLEGQSLNVEALIWSLISNFAVSSCYQYKTSNNKKRGSTWTEIPQEYQMC